MSNHFMLKTMLLSIMVLLAGNGCAQNYFVFLSAGDRQPFYVRLDSVAISSAPDGHLILAPLKDSTYQLTIGFPGETNSEQRYVFNMRQKDQEFQLKKHSDGGWGLFDEQAGDWLTPQAPAGKSAPPRSPGVRKDDAFSRMMADVVNDTAVLYNTYAMEEALKDSPVAVATKPAGDMPSKPAAEIASKPAAGMAAPDSAHKVTDSAVQAPVVVTMSESGRKAEVPPVQAPPAQTSTVQNPLVQAPAVIPRTDSPSVAAAPVIRRDSVVPASADTSLFRSPAISRLSERKTARGLRQVYTDRTGGGAKADTIVVIIPTDTPATAARPHADSVKLAQSSALNKARNDSVTLVQATAGHKPRIVDSPSVVQARKPRQDSTVTTTVPLVEMHPTPAGATAENHPHAVDSGAKHPARGYPKPETPFINSDCHIFATDYDVDRLRMKMLEAVKEDERIATARKAFKSKCYTTNQLRILSEVFGTDGGRYRFFEAAWPFAADAHFLELSSLITDPDYAAKFKTLTGQQ